MSRAMADGDRRQAWPSELIEFSIMTEVDRLAFILRFIVTQRPSRRSYNEDDVRAVVHTIGTFEGVLDDARLPRELDETLRCVIRRFRANPGPLPPELVDRYHDLVIDCLLRDLPAVPESVDEYRRRVAQLIARHWIGEPARVIPRGWLPIVERAVRVGEASVAPEAFRRVATVFMGERFGRLEWYPNGHRDWLGAILSYVTVATNVACMACMRPGESDGGPGRRTLKLCGRHRDLRQRDEPAFREALYPRGPPDHPDVKLY